MTVLAVAFLFVYGGPVIWPDLPSWVIRGAEAANIAIWAVFAGDLAIRLWLAENRVRWLVKHPIDLLTVLLPMLRPLRILRVFTAGHSLLTRRGGLMRTGQAILMSAAVLITVGALAVLDAERAAPGASIVTFPDALWWGMTTVTTVGYGDLYPVTSTGRIVAAALMVVGISVLGAITASVAAWFVSATATAEADGPGADAADQDQAPTARGLAGPAGPPPARSAGDLHAALAELRRAGVLTAEETATAHGRIVARP